jgi:hypothetical protein
MLQSAVVRLAQAGCASGWEWDDDGGDETLVIYGAGADREEPIAYVNHRTVERRCFAFDRDLRLIADGPPERVARAMLRRLPGEARGPG